jgi:hypothetical protein
MMLKQQRCGLQDISGTSKADGGAECCPAQIATNLKPSKLRKAVMGQDKPAVKQQHHCLSTPGV